MIRQPQLPEGVMSVPLIEHDRYLLVPIQRFGLAFAEVATAPNWAEGLKVLAGST